jgi:uncharacterized FlaG/YvyC family protein
MSIRSVPGSAGLTQPPGARSAGGRLEVSTPGSVEGSADQPAATAPASDAQRLVKALDAPRPTKPDRAQGVSVQRLDELKAFASREGLEVRLEQLPRNGGTVIRFVQPGTGEVVRQFPPEGVVRMLAELRARAEGRLDLQA